MTVQQSMMSNKAVAEVLLTVGLLCCLLGSLGLPCAPQADSGNQLGTLKHQ